MCVHLYVLYVCGEKEIFKRIKKLREINNNSLKFPSY